MAADGYSRSPKLLKGAMVQFSAPMIVPIPNIIIFQYNPEQLSRSLSPYAEPEPTVTQTAEKDGTRFTKEVRFQPYDPKESFNLTLFLDSSDALEEPEKHPVAALTGVADRIAALEMLLYPSRENEGLLSISVSVSVGGSGAAAAAAGQAAVDSVALPTKVPIVLFIWGPGRIVPVRLTSFTVDELQFNTLLYPHRARVTIGLRVVTSDELRTKEAGVVEELAMFAYDFTFKQKQVLALANIANTLESLGLLPF